MAVKKIFFILTFFLLLLKPNISIIIDPFQKSRILSGLSQGKRESIAKKLLMCNTKSCEKKLLLKSLKKISKKKNFLKITKNLKKRKTRKLAESQKNMIHILLISVFIFLMFNSNFNTSLIITGFIIWSVLLMILNKSTLHLKSRRLRELKNGTIVYGENHYNKIFDQEKPKLFDFLKNQKKKKILKI